MADYKCPRCDMPLEWGDEPDGCRDFHCPINGAYWRDFKGFRPLEYDYDNLPAEDEVENYDRKWSVGVIWDW